MTMSLVVHARGRWRAVAGLRGALCVARRGRLLALRRPRAARLTLGAALPYKYRRPQSVSSDSEGRAEPSRTKHKSRQHTNNQKTSVAVQCEARPDSGGAVPRRGFKRRRSSSSEAPPPQPQTLTTLATVHADKQHEPKRPKTEALHLKRKRRSTSSEGVLLKMSPKRSSKRKLGPSKRTSLSEERSPILPSRDISDRTNRPNRIQKGLKDQHKYLLKCKDAASSNEITSQRRNRQTGLVVTTDESDFETVKIKKHKSKSSKADKDGKRKLAPSKAQDRSSTNEPVKLGPTRAIDRSSTDEQTTLRPKKGAVASIDEPVKRKLQPKRTIDHSRKEQVQISPKKVIDSSSTDEPLICKKSPKRAKGRTTKEPDPKKVLEGEQPGSSRESPSSYKELVIDEQDVQLIRLYLQRHQLDEDLLRFDTDDHYKMMYFYRINPLVSVERCPRIATMIREASQQRLLYFASKLGLRSVSEASSTKRYRTRRRQEKSYALDSSDTDKDKENIDKAAPTSKTVGSGKVLKESLNKARRKKEKAIDGTLDVVELSSAAQSDQEKRAGRKEAKKPQPMKQKVMQPKVISSKRAAKKEYSNLEDHAIVAWVSTGARANCVNGNLLWRQLQEQYPRLTGQGRTWHSLRNRYLRYILPRLGALALPHAQQTRLRAAAATGELKARKKESRRNSMFPLPARGASSRRPRPFAVPSHAEPHHHDAEGERSPRYSALTRRFARAPAERSSGHATDDVATARHRSLSDSPQPRERRHASARRNSPVEINRRRSKRRNSPTETNGHTSKRRNVDEPNGPAIRPSSPTGTDRRRSKRRNSSTESNYRSTSERRRSRETNRRNSPTETNGRRSNRRNSPTETNGRKSNRRHSSSDTSTSGSTEPGRDPVATRRRTLARATEASPGRLPRYKQTEASPARPPRLRKLFNHRAVF